MPGPFPPFRRSSRFLSGLAAFLLASGLGACSFPASWRAVAGEPPPQAGTLRGGTGFFINGEGDLLTMRHVVEGCAALRLSNTAFQAVPAKVAALPADPGTDLAVIRIDRKTPAFARLIDIWPRAGQVWKLPARVVAYGYPEGGPTLDATAVELGDVRPARIGSSPLDLLFLSGEILHGNSGSPAFDERGRVLGIVFATIADPATLQRLHVAAGGFAIPTKEITQFLAQKRLKWQTAAADTPPLDEDGERAMVARVFCYE